MGMVVMSKRELNRLDVLARLDGDRLTARAAAELMTVTLRQTYRLLRRYRDGGAVACQSAFKFDPVSASNFDPFERRVLTVALASSELAGVAETWRARVA